MKTAAAVGCLAFSVSVASAQEITAIDFNGDLIGKVIPDGKVVSFENQLIGNITADSLIVNFEGNLIGRRGAERDCHRQRQPSARQGEQ